MEQALARFEQYLNRRFGQSSTRKHYRSDLRIFIGVVGGKAPQDVTPADIDAFIDDQIDRDLSPRTINRRLACIRSFFEYLAAERPEHHWPNPVINRRHTLKTGSRLPRDASDEDVSKIFAALSDDRDRAMFGLMVGAGLRVGEVSALQLEDIEESTSPGNLVKLRVRGKGDKERVVWLTPSLWRALQDWLEERPQTASDRVFLNWRRQPITVSGIQYRLKQHCQTAAVEVSCHELRHTFARRLVEAGLPVDSLSKLLGHSHLHTTQRYIDGADPTVRADFTEAMARLESTLIRDRFAESEPPQPIPPPKPTTASPAQLEKLRRRMADSSLPPWLREALDAYISWRWPTWRAQTAYQIGGNMISTIRRVWEWLVANRQIEGWETFRRSDLEAWLQARCQESVSQKTIENNLGLVRMLLRFAESHGCPVAPGLFRVEPPKERGISLPRYLPEAEYRRLETTVLESTQSDTYSASFDRAWFLTLAHTGVRLSEMLALGLEDLDLAGERAIVRGSKPGHDRVVFLTPALLEALHCYLEKRPELPDEGRVFVLHGRSPTPRTIQRRLKKYGEKAGVDVSPHKLRHTMATRLLNQGMPVQSLQKLLGHEQLNTTQIYARIYDETLYRQFREATARMERLTINESLQTITAAPLQMEIEVTEGTRRIA
jgi:site-specific recombinase XerD